MRYRIGEDMQAVAEPVQDGLISFSALLGLIMGIGFVVAGWRGKQFWLLSWGAGLVVASILYLTAEYMGYT